MQVSTIILAGGQGTRFNHLDKGLYRWRGKLLVEHVIDRVRASSDQVIISCNRNINQYRQLGFEICQDLKKDYLGPLAGIEAALPLIKHPYTLICPCDTPFLPLNLTKTLLLALDRETASAVFPVTERRKHFLPHLAKTSTLIHLPSHFMAGHRSVKSWLSLNDAKEVPFEESKTIDGRLQSFANLNSIEGFDEYPQ